MEIKKRRVASYLPFLGAFIVIILSLLALARILFIRRKLRHSSSAGRAISAKVSSVGMPLTTFNRYGNPGDPINMQIHGTDGQIGAAFATAGWYRADEIDFITSAPLVAAILEGHDAIAAARQMIGATNPLEAAPGSIRGDFALETGKNLVHGSDSPESAAREASLFFPDL